MTPSELDRLRARFEGVAQTLGDRLSAANPHLVALVAKWSKNDLVPGLSDLDFRIICDEATTADDWVEIDWHVGRIHRQMVEEHPEWNRINEHTPGAGINLAELHEDRFHHPEYSVWTVWWGRDDWAQRLKSRTLTRCLTAFDEHYHLARFLSYYSPYIHGIDPPINLAEFEPKYALHSRCWHYFAPPLLSAATLLARKHFASKREGLLWLVQHGFAAAQVDAVLEQVDSHYETPEQSDANRLRRFEAFLFEGFEEVLPSVREAIEHFQLRPEATWQQIQQYLASHTVDALMDYLENIRFARIRAGRYYFYLNAPAHFSADLQLLQEQSWTRKLVKSTFRLLRRLHGDDKLSIVECFERTGLEIDDKQANALQFVRSLAALPNSDRALQSRYSQAIEAFPVYYRLLEYALRRFVGGSQSDSDKSRAVIARVDGHESVAGPSAARLATPGVRT